MPKVCLPCPLCGGQLESARTYYLCSGCGRQFFPAELSLKCGVKKCGQRSAAFVVIGTETTYGLSKSYKCLCQKHLEDLRSESGDYLKIKEGGHLVQEVAIPENVNKIARPPNVGPPKEVVIRGEKRRIIRKGEMFS